MNQAAEILKTIKDNEAAALQQRAEDLVARRAELAELKSQRPAASQAVKAARQRTLEGQDAHEAARQAWAMLAREEGHLVNQYAFLRERIRQTEAEISHLETELRLSADVSKRPAVRSLW